MPRRLLVPFIFDILLPVWISLCLEFLEVYSIFTLPNLAPLCLCGAWGHCSGACWAIALVLLDIAQLCSSLFLSGVCSPFSVTYFSNPFSIFFCYHLLCISWSCSTWWMMSKIQFCLSLLRRLIMFAYLPWGFVSNPCIRCCLFGCLTDVRNNF